MAAAMLTQGWPPTWSPTWPLQVSGQRHVLGHPPHLPWPSNPAMSLHPVTMFLSSLVCHLCDRRATNTFPGALAMGSGVQEMNDRG